MGQTPPVAITDALDVDSSLGFACDRDAFGNLVKCRRFEDTAEKAKAFGVRTVRLDEYANQDTACVKDNPADTGGMGEGVPDATKACRDDDCVSPGHLVLTGVLNFEERREFIAATQLAIDAADTTVTVNCSAVDVAGPIDAAVVGMLIALVRAAQKRGARIVLVRAPRGLRGQFEAAGVAGEFDWRG